MDPQKARKGIDAPAIAQISAHKCDQRMKKTTRRRCQSWVKACQLQEVGCDQWTSPSQSPQHIQMCASLSLIGLHELV